MRSKTAGALAVIAGLAASATLPDQGLAQLGAQTVGAQTSALTEAYNATGGMLLERLGSPGGNIVLSPYSIGSAMSMTLAGARGDTASEMASVLKHSLDRGAMAAANGEVLATLNGYDRSAEPPTCPTKMQLTEGRCQATPDRYGDCPFSTKREGDRCMGGASLSPTASLLAANALMLPRTDIVSSDYASLLKDKYAAEVFQKASLADVNGWVAQKTRGKIGEILDRLDPNTAAVLLSAVYFKSRWASPFEEVLTKGEPFHVSSAQQVQAAMMHQTDHYALVARQNYRAIRLPYAIQELALVVVLPNEADGLGDVMRSIDANEQSALLAAFRANPRVALVALALPRFKVQSDLDLIPPLQAHGMALAFDNDRADFSGITGRPPADDRLAISLIRHRALIEVSEESTEAAAVTIVEMTAGAAPHVSEPIEDFRVDHPFLFYLADNATGAILFAGRVSSPTQFAGSAAIQAPAVLPLATVGPAQRSSPAAIAMPAPLPPVPVAPLPKRRSQ